MLHIQVGAGSGTVYLKSETKYEVVMSVLSRSNLHGHIAACLTLHLSPTVGIGCLCAVCHFPSQSPDSFSRVLINRDFNSSGQGL